MQFFPRLFIGLLCLVAVALLESRGDNATAEHRANRIAPFVGPQHCVVAHIDLEEFEVSAAADVLDLVGFPRARQTRAITTAERITQSILRAGGKEMFIVAALEDVREGVPHIVVPLADGGNPAAVINLLVSGDEKRGPESQDYQRAIADSPFDVAEYVEAQRAVFVGSAEDRRSVNDQRTAPKGLLDAFGAAAGASIQVAFIVRDPQRAVLAAAVSRTDAAVDQQEIARGLKWAAVAAELPPEGRFELIVAAKDGEAAEAIRLAIQANLQMIPNLPGMTRSHPQIAEALEHFGPIVEGSRIISRIHHQDGSFARALKLLRPDTERMFLGERLRILRQLAIGMHDYQTQEGHFPPPAIRDAEGNSLLSWRVAILPYLGEQELYHKFHLNEPWDSEHNRRLISRMPGAFADPESEKLNQQGKTRFVVPVAEGGVFESGKDFRGTRLDQITEGIQGLQTTGGLGGTLLLVHMPATRAVEWTRPHDWNVDLKHPRQGLFDGGRKVAPVAFCDAHGEELLSEVSEQVLRALVTRTGNDHLPGR